jgi:hypothetical protein
MRHGSSPALGSGLPAHEPAGWLGWPMWPMRKVIFHLFYLIYPLIFQIEFKPLENGSNPNKFDKNINSIP